MQIKIVTESVPLCARACARASTHVFVYVSDHVVFVTVNVLLVSVAVAVTLPGELPEDRRGRTRQENKNVT
ncbi:uncharacterized protein LOC143147690 isoform X3 [Ptiloglossa arizonensis]|uniref:uncharacterized protein LOC143147690 isoform X3 n=1 Tax=Ptiloglossa arizonensis TaxID=3350558 RepID=UPI003F9FC245